MCGFSPRLRRNIKNSRKSVQKKKFCLKKFRQILFLALFGRFFSFFYICTLEELLNASGLRKYQKMKFFRKCIFLWGLFWTKGVFSHGIPKKTCKFYYSVMFHNMFPLTICFYICCVKKLPSCQQLFLQLFFELFFSRFFEKFLLVYI